MPPLFALDELTEAQREANRTIHLIEKEWYQFDPPAEGLSFNRKFRHQKNAGVPMKFTIGQYLGYRPDCEEHMFYAKGDDGEWHLLPLYLTEGTDQTKPTERPDDAPPGT